MQGQRARSAVEVVIAAVLLGLVVGGVVTGLDRGPGSAADCRVEGAALALAQAELAYVMDSPYDTSHEPPRYDPDPDIDLSQPPYEGEYTVDITAVSLEPCHDMTGDECGQRITVTVLAYGHVRVSAEADKVNVERE